MKAKKELQECIDKIKELKDIQSKMNLGNTDIVSCMYNVGLYNGLEIAVALLEKREPILADVVDYEEEKKETGRTLFSGRRVI